MEQITPRLIAGQIKYAVAVGGFAYIHMTRDRPQKAPPTVVEASRANILVENPALKFDFAS